MVAGMRPASCGILHLRWPSPVQPLQNEIGSLAGRKRHPPFTEPIGLASANKDTKDFVFPEFQITAGQSDQF